MNIVMMPMWLLSGVFFASSNFPDVAQPFIRLLPLTALVDALRGVFLDGLRARRDRPRDRHADDLHGRDLRLVGEAVPLALSRRWGRRLRARLGRGGRARGGHGRNANRPLRRPTARFLPARLAS